MSVFGGVQVLGILFSLVRTKLVALWLGKIGIGMFGLYNSSLDVINSIAQLGLRNSAVRDIAGSEGSRVAVVATVVRRWSCGLGILGALLTLVLSPALSRWTFGDSDHTLGYMFLSVTVFLSSITSGELAILQGMSLLRRLARASVWGAAAGVAVSIPMFYYWRIDSVVPSIIAYSVTTAAAVFIYRQRGDTAAARGLSLRETFDAGKDFIRLGIFMTASGFVTLLVSYVFNAYLNYADGEDAVGLYQAGYTVVNRYVGLVFTAIAMEYYPRLVSAINSRRVTSVYVGHEMTLALWVLLPVLTIFIAADRLVVILLYDSSFLDIIPFIAWAMVGTVFRAVSWCIAFVILARGDGKIYLVTETLSALCSLPLNIIAYNQWGIGGLGYAYCAWYLLYTLIVGVVYFRRYRLSLSPRLAMLIAVVTVIGIGSVLLSTCFGWIPAAAVAAVATVMSFTSLRRMLRR